MRAHSPGSIPRGSWAEMKAAVGLRQTAADIVTTSVASSVCCTVNYLGLVSDRLLSP